MFYDEPENNHCKYAPCPKGPAIAAWFSEIAAKHTQFNTQLLDLAAINLPFLDEQEHPRFQKYQHQHTKDWSAMIADGDAFVIVLSEYNFGFPATIKNAIDYLYKEWNYKAVAFVSYGGVSGGTRAVEQLKLVISAVNMMPLSTNVHIPSFTKRIDESGKFNSDPGLDKSADGVLDELYKWAVALKTMREPKA